jgi:hypothetical protein
MWIPGIARVVLTSFTSITPFAASITPLSTRGFE